MIVIKIAWRAEDQFWCYKADDGWSWEAESREDQAVGTAGKTAVS